MIFVTGAEGFIGSHVVEELLRAGESVRALTFYNFQNSQGWLEEVTGQTRAELEVVAGDIRDPKFVLESMKGAQKVVHLAALIGIPYSYVAPHSYIDTNVLGTLNVLESALSEGVETVVVASTSEVYGSAQYVPIDEKHPQVAQSPYAASKIASDQLAISYHRSFSLPVTVLRPFNTFGPRQSLRAVVPQIISQLKAHPSFVALGDVNTKRDLTFVRDTARGFLAALDLTSGFGRQFNLGVGSSWTIGQIVGFVGEIMGYDPEIRLDPDRVRPTGSEVQELLSNNSLAVSELGWRPDFVGESGLKRALELTIQWFLSHPSSAQEVRYVT